LLIADFFYNSEKCLKQKAEDCSPAFKAILLEMA